MLLQNACDETKTEMKASFFTFMLMHAFLTKMKSNYTIHYLITSKINAGSTNPCLLVARDI